MPSNAAMPDDLNLLPEQDVGQYVERFAAAYQVTFERTRLDDWAEAVTRAAGDDVQLDGTGKLLVALKKQKLISGRQAARLLRNHCRETERARRPQAG